jgi:hypothetical protein
MISNVAEYCSPSEYVKNQEMQGKISSGQIISQLIAQNKKTRIRFAKGSLCGFYSGNISQGKEFVLKLAGGQLFLMLVAAGDQHVEIHIHLVLNGGQ